jgi:hypothetical protein
MFQTKNHNGRNNATLVGVQVDVLDGFTFSNCFPDPINDEVEQSGRSDVSDLIHDLHTLCAPQNRISVIQAIKLSSPGEPGSIRSPAC